MMQLVRGEWATEDVAVVQIADGEWRVSDPTHPEEDGLSILGVIESTRLGYETTNVRDPAVRHAFATLDMAVHARELSNEQFDETMKTNVFSIVWIIKAALLTPAHGAMAMPSHSCCGRIASNHEP
jgi:hypothetical protein